MEERFGGRQMWKISMYDPEYKRIREDAEALNFGQNPKLSSAKMERLLKAVAAAIKVERAADAAVETTKKRSAVRLMPTANM